MAMNVGMMRVSFFVNSWIIIHLGINPESGGSPPIESRISMVRVVVIGVLFHVWDNDSVVVVEFWISNINIVKVVVI